MQDLNILKTVSSPEITSSIINKKITIKGESYPENPFKFYEPLINFLTKYIEIESSLLLSMELVYYNSSTGKVFYDIFDILDESKIKIKIEWTYNKEDHLCLENGKEYANDYPKLNFYLMEA
jgi:hypothetical protein